MFVIHKSWQQNTKIGLVVSLQELITHISFEQGKKQEKGEKKFIS